MSISRGSEESYGHAGEGSLKRGRKTGYVPKTDRKKPISKDLRQRITTAVTDVLNGTGVAAFDTEMTELGMSEHLNTVLLTCDIDRTSVDVVLRVVNKLKEDFRIAEKKALALSKQVHLEHVKAAEEAEVRERTAQAATISAQCGELFDSVKAYPGSDINLVALILNKYGTTLDKKFWVACNEFVKRGIYMKEQMENHQILGDDLFRRNQNLLDMYLSGVSKSAPSQPYCMQYLKSASVEQDHTKFQPAFELGDSSSSTSIVPTRGNRPKSRLMGTDNFARPRKALNNHFLNPKCSLTVSLSSAVKAATCTTALPRYSTEGGEEDVIMMQVAADAEDTQRSLKLTKDACVDEIVKIVRINHRYFVDNISSSSAIILVAGVPNAISINCTAECVSLMQQIWTAVMEG